MLTNLRYILIADICQTTTKDDVVKRALPQREPFVCLGDVITR